MLDDLNNLYYFWDKLHPPYSRWTRRNTKPDERLENMFFQLIDITDTKFKMSMSRNGMYNGQTKAEFNKNFKRIDDIVSKSDGDVEKKKSLSRTQANRITDEHKAVNRAMVAREMKEEDIFEIFFERAYSLGSVSKQDYRQYKLEKLGL